MVLGPIAARSAFPNLAVNADIWRAPTRLGPSQAWERVVLLRRSSHRQRPLVRHCYSLLGSTSSSRALLVLRNAAPRGRVIAVPSR